MAYYRNKRSYRFKKSNYSPEGRFQYHTERYFSPGKFGVKFGSKKHLYSMGFCDAFSGIDNTQAIKHNDGKELGKAYSFGNKRGNLAASNYFAITGKQPFDLKYKR